MTILPSLLCDGCGQSASPEHIAKRLRRLECATRYRPVHISALFLGASCPSAENEFLYSGGFAGEACALLDALKISWKDAPSQEVLTEFQKGGFFLAHVLECPLETGIGGDDALAAQLARRAPGVIARIRRSLKPKRVVLFSQALEAVMVQMTESVLGCPVILDDGKPFLLEGRGRETLTAHLRNPFLDSAAAIG